MIVTNALIDAPCYIWGMCMYVCMFVCLLDLCTESTLARSTVEDDGFSVQSIKVVGGSVWLVQVSVSEVARANRGRAELARQVANFASKVVLLGRDEDFPLIKNKMLFLINMTIFLFKNKRVPLINKKTLFLLKKDIFS